MALQLCIFTKNICFIRPQEFVLECSDSDECAPQLDTTHDFVLLHLVFQKYVHGYEVNPLILDSKSRPLGLAISSYGWFQVYRVSFITVNAPIVFSSEVCQTESAGLYTGIC